MNGSKSKQKIKIAGAGVSGLSSAIFLAQKGYEVTVYEQNSWPGGRYQGDWQHLENWTKEQDICDYLKSLGIKLNFFTRACYEFSVYTPSGKEIRIRSDEPLFYSVKRGKGEDSIDKGLLKQAKELGVEVEFNTSVEAQEVNIMAAGPLRADGFVFGTNFEADTQDKIAVFTNKKVTDLYSYVEVINGTGTLACYHGEPNDDNLDSTKERAQEILGTDMINTQSFGARGNFFISKEKLIQDGTLYAGESAGFQDYLAGFGMTYAVDSAHLVAQSIAEGENYDELCVKNIFPDLKASYVNGILRAITPNFVINLVGSLASKGSVNYKKLLSNFYSYNWWHKLLYPLVRVIGPLVRRSPN